MKCSNLVLVSNASGDNQLARSGTSYLMNNFKRNSLQQSLGVDVRIKKCAAERIKRSNHLNRRNGRRFLPTFNRNLPPAAIGGEHKVRRPELRRGVACKRKVDCSSVDQRRSKDHSPCSKFER